MLCMVPSPVMTGGERSAAARDRDAAFLRSFVRVDWTCRPFRRPEGVRLSFRARLPARTWNATRLPLRHYVLNKAEASRMSHVRALHSGILGFAAALALSGSALALDEVTFGTNWLAQAEHGGFYQA